MQDTEIRWEDTNWKAWKARYGISETDFVNAADHIEVLVSRTGLPTVRVAGPNGHPVFLHSSIDPVKEAQRVAAEVTAEPGAILIVYGFAMGYLVEALLKTVNEKVPIFVLEPDTALFCAAMKARDLREVIANNRVEILVGESLTKIKDSFGSSYDGARYQRTLITGLAGHQTVYSDFFTKAMNSIKSAIERHQIILRTMIKFGPEVMNNAFNNLLDYHLRPGVNSLFGRFSNIPAIIVSAGPSLNKNIDFLHEAKGKAVILAVGTAAKALQKKGIEPDFLVSIDPGILNYRHFQGVSTENAALIIEMQSHYQILKDFAGPVFVSGETPILTWFKGVIKDKGFTESAGSVANNAFSAAYKMGANPIVLIGQDLSYGKDGHTHAAGTNYEKDVVNREANRGYINVKANDGGEVLTDAAFYQFLQFFETWIAKFPDREYINATEGGAFIEGTKIMPLREVLDQYCRKNVDVSAIIKEAENEFEVPSIKPLLERMEPQLGKMKDAFSEANTAMKHLQLLEKACESRQGKMIQKHLKAVRKTYQKFANDEFLSILPEWFSKKDVHEVMSRTYQAENTEKDDFSAAINDYNIYYEKMRDATEQMKGLIDMCIREAERRMQDGR